MDGPTEVCKEDTVPLEENCGDEVRNEIVVFLCLHRNNKQLSPFKMCTNQSSNNEAFELKMGKMSNMGEKGNWEWVVNSSLAH